MPWRIVGVAGIDVLAVVLVALHQDTPVGVHMSPFAAVAALAALSSIASAQGQRENIATPNNDS